MRQRLGAGRDGRAPVQVVRLGGAVLARAGAQQGDVGLRVGGQAERGHERGHAQRARHVVRRQRAHHAVQGRRLRARLGVEAHRKAAQRCGACSRASASLNVGGVSGVQGGTCE